MKDLVEPGRVSLPHQSAETFLMDGGLETTLIFHDGIDLPLFASFPLVDDEAGRELLRKYFTGYLDIAKTHGTGFVLETPTWRASPDWGAELGYDADALARVNRDAARFLAAMRDAPEYADVPVVLSGCIGPRGDGYEVGREMTIEEARAYHAPQVRALVAGGVEMVTALTMTYAAEGAGIALAARDAGVPAAVSFTVETDGRLPDGQALAEAIRTVDAATGSAPAYYMINCAHPTHFEHVLESDADWAGRVRGVRANASCMSHAELDAAEELDAGNPEELGAQYVDLKRALPKLNVIGGCCGTDHRHVDQMARHLGR